MSIYIDKVKCCNCNFVGEIEQGKEVCPKCKRKGCLAWQEETIEDNRGKQGYLQSDFK